ncbi:NAD(P)/FAD-dependent oxidoreductase [Rhodoferax sp.]|uniref:flavin-containing monooxygenase n=1 Tax=Rhodoferax sp. TaxID=50421 RepID=UPI002ACEA08A|nr:NAD(P)/FAD-dependent oxidoreductase [Rhodoferax sp.]MDZ7920043.1 NAD(P)/FAD-dependent oxidoreductase [Rhodoferax sp.]
MDAAYPQQAEIQNYILRVTDKYQLRPLIRFGTEVTALQWLAESRCWRVEVAGGEPLQARHVVLATGPLNKPLVPDIPGVQDFAGVAFHSNQWRHDVDLQGQRVAVVGTGASAVQFVPEIAQQASQVHVFQRTAAWVLPRWDQPYGVLRRWAYRWVPGLQRLSRWRVYWFNEMVGMGFMGSLRMQALLRKLALHHLARQVPSPAMQAALTPNFNPGCKRLLISNTWFPTLQQPHVQLHTQAVVRVTPQGLVGADGTLTPCDVIVWGTGFKATEFVAPMQVFGEAQEGVVPELSAQWRTAPAATKLGITVAGFPNLYLLVGPNTGLGHNSLIFMIECQMDYIVQALQHLRRSGQQVLCLRAAVADADYCELQDKMKGTVWASGCHSWYQNARGHIDTLWPGYTWQYWLQTRRFKAEDYL